MNDQMNSNEPAILYLQGRLSNKAISCAKTGLPSDYHPDELFFLSFADSDVPLNCKFNLIFELFNSKNNVETLIKINAATQQFGKPFEYIPKGWKTICWIKIGKEAENMINKIPIIDSWDYMPKYAICLMSTFDYFKDKYKKDARRSLRKN